MWLLFAAVICVSALVNGAGRSEVPEYREFYQTLANVTLDRYMDLISMPQVPSRYVADEDHSNKWILEDSDDEYIRSYQVTSCRDEKSSVVKHSDLRVEPDPLVFPGTIKLTSDIQVLEDLNDPIKIRIQMRRRMVYFWMDLPCLAQYGSCVYENICESSVKCPIFYDLLGLPCGCPIKKGNYTTVNKAYHVPDVLPTWLTSGDYQVILKASSGSRSLFCIHFKLSVEGPDDRAKVLSLLSKH